MKRTHGLAGALVATLLAAWWAAGLDDADTPPPAGASRKAARAAVAPPDVAGLARHARGSRDASAGARPDLFAPRSFLPPPPPEPAPVPVVPPLPFRYSGLLEDGGPPAALVARGDDIRVLRAGDVVDGQYRVTAVGRGRIDFVYLPLNASQSLVTGALP